MTSRAQLILYQRQVGATLNAFDLKLTHVYKNDDLKKFGFNKENPTYTLDVNSNVNVTDDYYINEERYLPTGTILPYAGLVSPVTQALGQYWLLCQGQALSTTTYAKLFAIIGYTYGGSDGTFYLPDLRGRAPIGSGTGIGLTARSLGNTGGEENHLLSEAEMPAHSHTINDYKVGTQNIAAAEGGSTTASDETTIQKTSNATGGGGAHNNMQPFIVLNYIIRI